MDASNGPCGKTAGRFGCIFFLSIRKGGIRVPIEIANIAMEASCFLFLMTMFAALLYKRERTRPLRLIMLIFGGLIVTLAADLLLRIMDLAQPIVAAAYIDMVISYIAKVFLVCSFTWYFYARFEEKGRLRIDRRWRWWVLGYALIITLLFVTSIWTHWFFYLDDMGRVHQTESVHGVILLFLPLVLFDLFIILRHRSLLGWTDTFLLLLYIVLPLGAVALDLKFSTSIAHLALTLDACMLYTFVDAEQEQQLAHSRQELAEMNLNSMVSQINPHFLYNTLGSIESLSVDRPDEARELLSMFSEYLGDNYVDLTKTPLISFQKELEHVDHYLSIEKVRFPNLKVVYDIKTTDFEVPCLSVQPLAENAVKHGICRQRRSEGTVRITSEEREGAYVVRVEDDGAGFDPTVPPEDGRRHVGIENVTKRLELLCGGTLTIRSRSGEGTVCEMTIPKGG